MDELKLIEIVQTFECLYDRKHPHFKNKFNKADVWNAVALAMESSVEECQRVWLNVRTRYVKARKKILLGIAVEEEISWPAMKAAQFLDKHIQPRRRRTYGTIIKNAESPSGGMSPTRSRSPSRSRSSPSPSRTPSPSYIQCSPMVVKAEEITEELLTPTPIQTTQSRTSDNRGRANAKEDDMDASLKTTLVALGGWLTNKSKGDADQSFGQCVADMMITVPKRFKTRVKIEIMEVIEKYQQFEEEMESTFY